MGRGSLLGIFFNHYSVMWNLRKPVEGEVDNSEKTSIKTVSERFTDQDKGNHCLRKKTNRMQQKNLVDYTDLCNPLHWSLFLHLGKPFQELLDNCLAGKEQAGGSVVDGPSTALEHGDHQPVKPSLTSNFLKGLQHPECFPQVSEVKSSLGVRLCERLPLNHLVIRSGLHLSEHPLFELAMTWTQLSHRETASQHKEKKIRLKSVRSEVALLRLESLPGELSQEEPSHAALEESST